MERLFLFSVSYKIMNFNIILDNYILQMIAEKQSISDNYNSFVLRSMLTFSNRGGTWRKNEDGGSGN